mmetsp:Transcript_38866/g.91486  ORF Transcript_38866/g.91486 Transcript_38866/m.91486 type:complete len:532 (+) Transcript_38866:132-1727(+)
MPRSRGRHKGRGSPRRSPYRQGGSDDDRRSPSRRPQRARSCSASRSRRRSGSRPKRRRRKRRTAASRSASSSKGSGDGEAPNKIWVPHGDCARIIGRKGETRIDMERQSEASIRIQREEDMEGNKKERWIEVMGTPRARKTAVQLIMKIASVVRDDNGRVLKDGGSSNSYREPPNGSGGAAPSEVIFIRSEEIGRIIGRGGETIKSIEESSGAKVDLDRNQGKVEIRGSEQAVRRATDMVVAEVTYARLDDGTILKGDEGRGASPPRGGSDSCASGSAMRLYVSSKEAGKVIGRGGETVREIMQRTGAEIKVQRTEDSDANSTEREISVYGTSSQKEEVYFAIAREVTFLRGESGVIKTPEMSPPEAEEALFSRAPIKLSRPGPVPGGPGMMPPGMMPGMMPPPGMMMPGMMPPGKGGPPPEGWPPMMPPPGMCPFPPGMMGGPPGMGMPPPGGARSSSSSSSSSSSASGEKKAKKALKKAAAGARVQGAYGVSYQPAWGASGGVGQASQKKKSRKESATTSLKDIEWEEL